MRDDGAQMYTGIDARTLNKKTSNRGSSRSTSRQGSPHSSGDLNRRSSNGCVLLLESCVHCRQPLLAHLQQCSHSQGMPNSASWAVLTMP